MLSCCFAGTYTSSKLIPKWCYSWSQLTSQSGFQAQRTHQSQSMWSGSYSGAFYDEQVNLRSRNVTVSRNIQLSQASKLGERITFKWWYWVVEQMPARAVRWNHAKETWLSIAAYNRVSFPSPVKAPLAIDMIRLLSIDLCEQWDGMNRMTWQRIFAYKYVRLPNPVNAPLAIDVIRLLCRDLHQQ